MTSAIRIPTSPPGFTSLERWRHAAALPIGPAIDAHLDSILATHLTEVAPPPPAVSPAVSARKPRIPRWTRFEPIVERTHPTYLAFESPQRLNEYLRARTLLADRTRA